MPTSSQAPLAAPRGASTTDMSQPRTSWEAACFDDAEYYTVVEVRHDRRETRFRVFPWAARFASGRDDACLYAVSASGRFALLDRERWWEWEIRWLVARGMIPNVSGAPPKPKPHRGTITGWERRPAPQGLGFCVEGRMGGLKVLTTSVLAQDGDEVETLNWRYTLDNSTGR